MSYWYPRLKRQPTPRRAQPIYSPGPWSGLVAVRGCICSDGKRRFARVTGEPDTFFSAPAQVQVSHEGKRYTVTGFVTGWGFSTDPDPDWKFISNSQAKNGYLLPGTTPPGEPGTDRENETAPYR